MKQLRVIIITGVILLLLSAIALSVFFFIEKSSLGTARQLESFNRLLNEYDRNLQNMHITENDFLILHLELDKLENRAVALESWLSILKRRRYLASIHQPSLEYYRNSIEKALNIYPGSSAVMAIAAASLIKDMSIDRPTDELLRKMLPLITDYDFNLLRLSFYVIMGYFRNPERALELPADIYTDGTEAVTVDLIILKILRGEYREASADIQILLNNSPSIPSTRFAAEFHYDFGELRRSAEIFSYINDEQSLVRQADALYLDGYQDMAAAIWGILADLQNDTSIYNLALAAKEPEATEALLERLIGMETVSNNKSRQYALIQYSRFMDHTKAISFLRNSVNFAPQDYPYIDLEIAKRFADGRDHGRQIAETWLLLDRHEYDEELFKWAAWNFFYQRSFDEAKILLDRLDKLGITSPWVSVYRAIQLMNEGYLNEAERLLRSVPEEYTGWYVPANLGCILDTLSSPVSALDQYDLAAAKVKNRKIAARIYIRAARCLKAINRLQEERRTLMRALENDPDNLTARRELERAQQ